MVASIQDLSSSKLGIAVASGCATHKPGGLFSWLKNENCLDLSPCFLISVWQHCGCYIRICHHKIHSNSLSLRLTKDQQMSRYASRGKLILNSAWDPSKIPMEKLETASPAPAGFLMALLMCFMLSVT